MTMAMTIASRGRSTKSAEIIGFAPGLRRAGRVILSGDGLAGCRRHGLAGADALHAFADHQFAFV